MTYLPCRALFATLSALTSVILTPFAAAGQPTSLAAPSDPKLRAEILRRVRSDQAVRQESIESAHGAAFTRHYERIDADNTAFLKRVIARHGWPSVRLVGAHASSAAFLLVQHSPDLAFQARCLPLLRSVAWPEPDEEHGIALQDVALLTDRVRMRGHQKQVYGTQFIFPHGVLQLYPVADPVHLAERRRAMGLQKESDYLAMAAKLYAPEIARAKARG